MRQNDFRIAINQFGLKWKADLGGLVLVHSDHSKNSTMHPFPTGFAKALPVFMSVIASKLETMVYSGVCMFTVGTVV